MSASEIYFWPTTVTKICFASLLASAIVLLPGVMAAGTLEKYQLPPQAGQQSQMVAPPISVPGIFQQFEAEIAPLSRDEKIQLINHFSRKQSESIANNNFQAAEYYANLLMILNRNTR